jgi:sialic acid synthase SpsE
MADYQKRNTAKTESQLEMLSRLVLSESAHASLAAHARARGIVFMSSPFDEASVDLLDALEVPAFKIASGELTNHPFLRYVARKGRPIILSTGMATLEEVADAVAVLRTERVADLVLLHCVTSYPANPSDSNLRAMRTLSDAFGVPVGWSDHSLGTTVSLAAVALGASVIEKHFTLDKSLPGPDHSASLEPQELRDLVEGVRTVEASLGDGVKAPAREEREIARVARRSLHATRTLPAGHVLERQDLEALRPGDGCSPAKLEALLGRKLNVALRAGEMLREHDVDA